MRVNPEVSYASVPMSTIGPIKINGEVSDEINVPLATFESPLWPSTNRGAKASRLSNGLNTVIISECMTRSIVIEAKSGMHAFDIISNIKKNEPEFAKVVAKTSSFARLDRIDNQVFGRVLYLRFSFYTADASGHNMVTKAADALLAYCLDRYKDTKHISVSGNFCVDKKVSAVNGILGRGKNVVSDAVIPRKVCIDVLKTTPEKIAELNIKKNLMGSILAGSLRSANAHFANMMLAFYLATGQDAANIVEGSQGMVSAEVTETGDLYFAVTVPNIIVGAIGNGKHHDFVKHNLKILGCLNENAGKGDNSRRLAIIMAATIWCGEISLLAAQTNYGELMNCHYEFERKETV
tara:strand:- start:5104 stop:6156 length:1053 start_codon:yes stop_codon:yes gene_type:complete